MNVILVFLVPGALANVFVAWGCAFFVPVHESEPHFSLIAVITQGEPFERNFYEMRRIGGMRRVEWIPDENEPPVVRDMRGLPMLSLSCELHTKSDSTDCYAVKVTGGIGIVNIRDEGTICPALAVAPGMIPGGIPGFGQGTGPVADPDFYSAIVLPCHPIWWGFAVNTVLFAVAFLTLIRGPSAVRRAVRSLGGRCIECGYDLRADQGSGCPECGWDRTAGSSRR